MSEEPQKKNRPAEMAKPTEVLDHWPMLIENFQFSPQEFYARVEKALADRQIPQIELSRVDWKEGGSFSARREYLRVTRERLVFDVCAAPFGTGFFVSHWYGIRPKKLGFILFCLFALIVAIIWDWIARPRWGLYVRGLVAFDFNRQSALVVMLIALVIALFAFYVVWQMRSPPLTFYRIDLMCMYRAAVHNAVVQVIDEITKPQGISPLTEFDRRPVFRDLLPRQWQRSGNGRA